MKIYSVHVRNLRSLEDVTLKFSDRTALIGPNGAGKSSILRGLDLFYEPNASYTEDDFYNRETEREIAVRVTFTDLGERAQKRFSSYFAGDTLSVEKVMTHPAQKSNQSYYGNRLVNPDFTGFRTASGQDLRRQYNQLREEGFDLPEYQNQDIAEEDLRSWEENHPEECERQRDDGQFFGFNPVGQAALEDFTQFILIPAVRDASQDAQEGRGSALTELMDLVVRATLTERDELKELEEETQSQYEELIQDASEGELNQLETDLTSTLMTLAPGAEVDLTWSTDDLIDIPMPEAEIRLKEETFSASVEHSGHGLQRAFIITLLQHLAVRSQTREEEEDTSHEPSLILGIEEPELYQHPNRQRHLARILSRFGDSGVSGVADSVQVIYSTHSPLLVDIERFDDVRAVRKQTAGSNLPSTTRVEASSLVEVARRLEDIAQVEEGQFSAESTRARLKSVMRPWVSEGFFSDLAVLVEGLQDRAAIIGYARAHGLALESEGVAVIPCGGKTKISKPAIIFSNLGIDVYVVFDADRGDDGEERNNRRLLRLVGEEEEDWPDGVYESYASFEHDLEEAIKSSVGRESYEETMGQACNRHGYSSTERGQKNPVVMEDFFSTVSQDGIGVGPIEAICDRLIQEAT